MSGGMPIDACECLDCVCDRPTRPRAGVYLCGLCRRGRHRRAKREQAPERQPYDLDKERRLAAMIDMIEERQR